MTKYSIDTYKLTSMEEPSDEILSQLMREAAEDARIKGEAAHRRYHLQYVLSARKALVAFKAKNPTLFQK